jgi:hypothetical protein
MITVMAPYVMGSVVLQLPLLYRGGKKCADRGDAKFFAPSTSRPLLCLWPSLEGPLNLKTFGVKDVSKCQNVSSLFLFFMGNIHLPNLLVKVLIKNLITCPDKASFSEHFVL